ncbi:hypothetical protein ACWCXB_34115, partial [Streptomyces sp. NPDC001514]
MPADPGTRAALAVPAKHRPEPVPLLWLYSVVDSASLPDIGNGYFIGNSLRGNPGLQAGEETHPWPGVAKRRSSL